MSAASRGTRASGVRRIRAASGLIEKIPYLQRLGITHVELMPVMAFDPQDVPPGTGAAGLTQLLGLQHPRLLRPAPGLLRRPERRNTGASSATWSRPCTAPASACCWTWSSTIPPRAARAARRSNFKGLGNETFYMLDADDRTPLPGLHRLRQHGQRQPPLRRALHHRLPGILGARDARRRLPLRPRQRPGARRHGVPMEHPPVLWGIELSDVLAGSKIIAEAWDAAGLYHVGSFPGYRWMEWNGKYRDSLRALRARRPRPGRGVATRIAGSSDLYQGNLRHPINSINFVTCHDGFTLADLVATTTSTTPANHEGNRDGCDHDLSWNCGVEGETDDPASWPCAAARRRTSWPCCC
jgi:isoamylase